MTSNLEPTGPGLPIPPEIAPLTRPGEALHAVHEGATLERHGSGEPNTGTVYLTSERLIHVTDSGVTALELDEMVSSVVFVHELLLIQTATEEVALSVTDPRSLQAEMDRLRAVRTVAIPVAEPSVETQV